MRDRAADLLDRIAVALWTAAHRLRPVYDGPVCPDCQIAPDPGPQGECDVCRQKWEHHQIELAVAFHRAQDQEGESPA